LKISDVAVSTMSAKEREGIMTESAVWIALSVGGLDIGAGMTVCGDSASLDPILTEHH
jgi:hypothetical protein